GARPRAFDSAVPHDHDRVPHGRAAGPVEERGADEGKGRGRQLGRRGERGGHGDLPALGRTDEHALAHAAGARFVLHDTVAVRAVDHAVRQGRDPQVRGDQGVREGRVRGLLYPRVPVLEPGRPRTDERRGLEVVAQVPGPVPLVDRRDVAAERLQRGGRVRGPLGGRRRAGAERHAERTGNGRDGAPTHASYGSHGPPAPDWVGNALLGTWDCTAACGAVQRPDVRRRSQGRRGRADSRPDGGRLRCGAAGGADNLPILRADGSEHQRRTGVLKPIGRATGGTAVFVAVAALPGSAPVGAQDGAITGYSAGAAERQRAREIQLMERILPSDLNAMSRELSREPHVAGSDAQARTRDRVLEWTRSWGLESEAPTYTVFLPWATEVELEQTAPVRRRFELREPPIEG